MYNTAIMQKDGWLSFLCEKIRSQIALENVGRVQNWAFAILTCLSFGYALNGLVANTDRSFVYAVKALFLALSNLILVLAIYLPGLLQKGEKTFIRFFKLHDFTSLISVYLMLAFYAAILCMLNIQVIHEIQNIHVSMVFLAAAWLNGILMACYLIGCSAYFAGLFFFPKLLARWVEGSARRDRVALILHSALLVLWIFGYNEVVVIGSTSFMEQLRIAGLFWMALSSALLFVAHFLQGTVSPALTALEFDVVSGRLERTEDILTRYKEAFMLRRLYTWIRRTAHHVATHAHEIAQYLHEAVTFISFDKPTEAQISQVEDRYRRANQIYRRLEKNHERFLLNISFFNLLEIEREKVEQLKDQFSKELRHAKLELSSVRKRIDDRLLALKEGDKTPLVKPAPTEELPLGR